MYIPLVLTRRETNTMITITMHSRVTVATEPIKARNEPDCVVAVPIKM